MIIFKTAYFYMLAVKINLIKIIKRIYFKTNFYRNIGLTKNTKSIFFFPNPFLMSSFTNYKKFTHKINNIDPSKLWDQNYSTMRTKERST